MMIVEIFSGEFPWAVGDESIEKRGNYDIPKTPHSHVSADAESIDTSRQDIILNLPLNFRTRRNQSL